MDNNDLDIYADPDHLADAAATRIIALAADAIAARQRFSIGLSGGSTPRRLFRRLAAEPARIDWARVHIFWGDERHVPPDHPDSNYRMVRETLLDHVPVPPENIYRVHAETDPEQAAAEYEQILRMFFAEEHPPQPRFDLLLQGLGDDGHTASLFPDTHALHERTRWVLENYVPRLESWRITLTAPAINAAAQVIFLVSGASKAAALYAVLRGSYQPQLYPAQLIHPTDGRLLWMVDRAAAARL